jgi:hypothetical protein
MLKCRNVTAPRRANGRPLVESGKESGKDREEKVEWDNWYIAATPH